MVTSKIILQYFTHKYNFAATFCTVIRVRSMRNSNFFFFEELTIIALLAYRTRALCQDCLGDRRTDELPASPGFSDNLLLARSKTTVSALRMEQFIEPFYSPLLFSIRRYSCSTMSGYECKRVSSNFVGTRTSVLDGNYLVIGPLMHQFQLLTISLLKNSIFIIRRGWKEHID